MKKLKGTHTSLTPLAEEIFEILTKKSFDKSIQISPGLITRKNIKVKQVSIKLKEDSENLNAGVILCEVLMKGSKQYLRIYNSNILEIKKLLKNYCESKQILLK
jgi:hypothetical protein